jgi:thiamine biosynthesis lipoprotein
VRLAVPAEIDPAALRDWRPDARLVDLSGETMGTTWRIRLAAPHGFLRGALEQAIASRLEAILAGMSHWRANSALGRFNRASAGTWIALPRDFAHVMEAAFQVFERSGGAFDPAIGALVDAWGFGPEPVATMPDDAEVERLRALSGAAHLAFDRETGRLRQSGGLRLDLSGIAKGFAVDALGEVLCAHDCNHALVEIGGELLGLGLRPDGDPWWVDLETPDSTIPPMRVALHQLAVATSGDYVRGRHTIDPRSGRPVEHALAVSVIHKTAMLADAWATALGVLQAPDMQARAVEEKLAVRAITRSEAGACEWISPALAAMLVEPELA